MHYCMCAANFLIMVYGDLHRAESKKNVVYNLRCRPSGTTHPRLSNNLPHVRGKLSHFEKYYFNHQFYVIA